MYLNINKIHTYYINQVFGTCTVLWKLEHLCILRLNPLKKLGIKWAQNVVEPAAQEKEVERDHAEARMDLSSFS